MSTHRYTLQPYDIPFTVHIGARRPKGLRGSAAAFRGTTSNRAHIYLSPEATTNDVVHEAVHVGLWVLDTVHVPYDSLNAEALTYLTAHVVDLCLKALAC